MTDKIFPVTGLLRRPLFPSLPPPKVEYQNRPCCATIPLRGSITHCYRSVHARLSICPMWVSNPTTKSRGCLIFGVKMSTVKYTIYMGHGNHQIDKRTRHTKCIRVLSCHNRPECKNVEAAHSNIRLIYSFKDIFTTLYNDYLNKHIVVFSK